MRRKLLALVVVALVALAVGITRVESASAAASAETSAVNWALAQVGHTEYGGVPWVDLCLPFVQDAYADGTGPHIDIQSIAHPTGGWNGSTDPEKVWSGTFSAGTTGGSSTVPPYGALVFFDAKPGYNPEDFSHVEIMGSNREMIGTPGKTGEAVFEETLALHATSGDYNTYVGWWLPDGAKPASPTPVVHPYVTWTKGPSLPVSFVLANLSCAGSFCLAIGTTGNRTLELVGDRWKPVAPPPASVGRVDSLSCPTATFCMAVANLYSPAGHDKLGNELVRLSAYILQWRAGDWQKPFHAYSYTGISTYTSLHTVVCTSPSFCMVVSTPSGSISWNGSHWSTYRGVTSGTDGNGTLACASPSFCVAGFDGAANLWRNGAWALVWPSALPPASINLPGFAGFLSGLACPTATFCMATETGGSIATWNGHTWLSSTLVPVPGTILVSQAELGQIACSSPSFCLGTEGYNPMGIWDGSSWRELPYEPDDFACIARTSTCYAVSGSSVVQYQFLKHGAHPAGFYTARQAWLDAASVDAAQQGEYWDQAAADLRPAAQSRPAYAAIVKALTNLASLPDTGATQAQQHEFAADLTIIRRFFDTPYVD
jgi:hypothetical protein